MATVLGEIRLRANRINELISAGQLGEALGVAKSLREFILRTDTSDSEIAAELANVEAAIASLTQASKKSRLVPTLLLLGALAVVSLVLYARYAHDTRQDQRISEFEATRLAEQRKEVDQLMGRSLDEEFVGDLLRIRKAPFAYVVLSRNGANSRLTLRHQRPNRFHEDNVPAVKAMVYDVVAEESGKIVRPLAAKGVTQLTIQIVFDQVGEVALIRMDPPKAPPGAAGDVVPGSAMRPLYTEMQNEWDKLHF